jgi:phosphatidylethanolamine/phosphatidyl-N-methylethanolamine N-methyltransferase
MKENIVFFKEFLSEFQTTGSCFPTSRWAAEALTNPIRAQRNPQRILELGPGTGSVTKQILSDLIPGDKLTICEINENFMKSLQKSLKKNPDFIKHQENIDFFMGPMQDLPENIKYDLIVCALPFLNFPISMVKEIFEKLARLGAENSIMTYYEYIGIRTVRKNVGSEPSKQKFQELDKFFKSIYKAHEMKRTRIWLNVMPINIYTLKLAA